LLFEIVSFINGVNTVTLSNFHSSLGMETESVKTILLLHAQTRKIIIEQKSRMNLFIPFVIKPSFFSAIILTLILSLSCLCIKSRETIILQEIA
jgi:hypothetical protein